MLYVNYYLKVKKINVIRSEKILDKGNIRVLTQVHTQNYMALGMDHFKLLQTLGTSTSGKIGAGHTEEGWGGPERQGARHQA